MNSQFIYSVLQYKHSLALGESLNIGVLFSFSIDNKLYYVSGDTQRLKCLYPTFDLTLISKISKNIKSKVDFANDSFNPLIGKESLSFKDYINSEILAEDSSSLQFSDPSFGVNIADNPQKTIEEFSKILLPSLEKVEDTKHDDKYILEDYTKRLRQKISSEKFSNRLYHDYKIESPKTKTSWVFEYGWRNETKIHLVKPVSFDLTYTSNIQEKAVRIFGYLEIFKNQAKSKDLLFDLLIAAPHEPNLRNAFSNALKTIQQSKAPTNLYTEDQWEKYSAKTAQNLNKELN